MLCTLMFMPHNLSSLFHRYNRHLLNFVVYTYVSFRLGNGMLEVYDIFYDLTKHYYNQHHACNVIQKYELVCVVINVKRPLMYYKLEY